MAQHETSTVSFMFIAGLAVGALLASMMSSESVKELQTELKDRLLPDHDKDKSDEIIPSLNG
jgi:hypothetical protein